MERGNLKSTKVWNCKINITIRVKVIISSARRRSKQHILWKDFFFLSFSPPPFHNHPRIHISKVKYLKCFQIIPDQPGIWCQVCHLKYLGNAPGVIGKKKRSTSTESQRHLHCSHFTQVCLSGGDAFSAARFTTTYLINPLGRYHVSFPTSGVWVRVLVFVTKDIRELCYQPVPSH